MIPKLADVPKPCFELLTIVYGERARGVIRVPIDELPEQLRDDARRWCERHGLVIGVVLYTGDGGGWLPASGLTHRPEPTHVELTNWGLAIVEDALLAGNERGATAPSESAQELPLESRAIGYLHNNPDATIAAIARALNVHRQRLYDIPGFMEASERVKAQRALAIPRGRKSKDGGIEVSGE